MPRTDTITDVNVNGVGINFASLELTITGYELDADGKQYSSYIYTAPMSEAQQIEFSDILTEYMNAYKLSAGIVTQEELDTPK